MSFYFSSPLFSTKLYDKRNRAFHNQTCVTAKNKSKDNPVLSEIRNNEVPVQNRLA